MPSSRVSQTKPISLAALLAVIWALAGGALAASAQGGIISPCPGGSDCIDGSDFTTGTDGWSSAVDGITLTHLDSHSVGPTDSASGVLEASGFSSTGLKSISKSIYLPAGNYVLIFRAVEDWTAFASPPDFWINYPSGLTIGYGTCFSNMASSWSYTTETSCLIPITDPGNVSLQLVVHNTTYFDYIYLERVPPTMPTATPDTSYATPTPRPGTSIPPEAMATPQPTSSPFCVSKPATPAVPTFQALTPTPTATPDGSGWGLLDTFPSLSLNKIWQAAGADINLTGAADHTGGNSHSIFIAYSGIPQSTTSTANLNEGLILKKDLPGTFYVNGWAQADAVPIGATGYIQLWTFNSTSSLWTMAQQFPISAQRWYPFHAEVAGGVTALAFVATRSDDPAQSSGGIYLDDVYVYGSLSLAPYCSGGYPASVTDVNGTTNPDAGGIPLSIPENKPCPPPIDQPNNFWGYLLAGLTYFMDQVFAQTPYHIPGQFQALMQSIVFSPLLGMFTYLSILFDWTIPLWVLGIMVGIWIIYSMLLIWKFARRATIE